MGDQYRLCFPGSPQTGGGKYCSGARTQCPLWVLSPRLRRGPSAMDDGGEKLGALSWSAANRRFEKEKGKTAHTRAPSQPTMLKQTRLDILKK